MWCREPSLPIFVIWLYWYKSFHSYVRIADSAVTGFRTIFNTAYLLQWIYQHEIKIIYIYTCQFEIDASEDNEQVLWTSHVSWPPIEDVDAPVSVQSKTKLQQLQWNNILNSTGYPQSLLDWRPSQGPPSSIINFHFFFYGFMRLLCSIDWYGRFCRMELVCWLDCVKEEIEVPALWLQEFSSTHSWQGLISSCTIAGMYPVQLYPTFKGCRKMFNGCISATVVCNGTDEG